MLNLSGAHRVHSLQYYWLRRRLGSEYHQVSAAERRRLEYPRALFLSGQGKSARGVSAACGTSHQLGELEAILKVRFCAVLHALYAQNVEHPCVPQSAAVVGNTGCQCQFQDSITDRNMTYSICYSAHRPCKASPPTTAGLALSTRSGCTWSNSRYELTAFASVVLLSYTWE